MASLPRPRSRSAAKFSMPFTKLSPLVSARALSAAGFEARKLAGENASVSNLVKNSARRRVRGSTSSALEIRAFIQSAVTR